MGEERLKIVLEPLPYKVRIVQLLWSKLIDSDLPEYIKHKRYGWTAGQESLWTETKSLQEFHPHRDTQIHTNMHIHRQVCIAIKQHVGYEPLSLPCLKAFEEHFQDLQRIW